jgi:hypothetical protein
VQIVETQMEKELPQVDDGGQHDKAVDIVLELNDVVVWRLVWAFCKAKDTKKKEEKHSIVRNQ